VVNEEVIKQRGIQTTSAKEHGIVVKVDESYVAEPTVMTSYPTHMKTASAVALDKTDVLDKKAAKGGLSWAH